MIRSFLPFSLVLTSGFVLPLFAPSTAASATGDDADLAGRSALRQQVTPAVDAFLGPIRSTRDQFVRQLLLADPEYLRPGEGVPVARLRELSGQAERLFNGLFGGGAPTVIIFWEDRIEENRVGRVTERNLRQSWAGQQLEEKFVESGFRVLDGTQVERIRQKNLEFAGPGLNDLDLRVYAELARDFGADLFLVGYSHAIGPRADDRLVPGSVTYTWTATIMARLFWTDTAEVVATLGQKGVASDLDANQGRLDALRRAGGHLDDKFLWNVWARWSRWAFEGRTLTVTVLNCDAAQALEIKRALETIIGHPLRGRPANQTTRIDIHEFTGATDELAAQLTTQAFSFGRLRLDEASFHALRLTVEN
jgi:hypothetical protein